MRLIAATIALLCATLTVHAADYAVVVSVRTNADPQWHTVVEAPREKHDAIVIQYGADVVEALPDLRAAFPRYACFVATPAEAGHDGLLYDRDVIACYGDPAWEARMAPRVLRL